MSLRLYRTDTSDEGTAGILVFGDDWIYTLELPWRDNRPNHSHIPPGRYAMQMRDSPKYGPVYEVMGVRGRTHILLHHGNFAGDRTLGHRTHSAGCILVGTRRGRLGGQLAVLGSRIARRKLETALDFETVTIDIVNAYA